MSFLYLCSVLVCAELCPELHAVPAIETMEGNSELKALPIKHDTEEEFFDADINRSRASVVVPIVLAHAKLRLELHAVPAVDMVDSSSNDT